MGTNFLSPLLLTIFFSGGRRSYAMITRIERQYDFGLPSFESFHSIFLHALALRINCFTCMRMHDVQILFWEYFLTKCMISLPNPIGGSRNQFATWKHWRRTYSFGYTNKKSTMLHGSMPLIIYKKLETSYWILHNMYHHVPCSSNSHSEAI